MIPVPSNDHCTCCEVIGEDPSCALHGRGTAWRRENPDPCPECGGAGVLRAAPRSTGFYKCEYCNGTGTVADSEEEPPFFDASVDTLPKGQDAKQGLAGTESGAVAKPDAQSEDRP